MAKEVIMPKFGFTQEESEILEWIKHEGDLVEKGDPIALVSTDKLSMEIEAPETGTLAGILFQVGAKVPVTKTIAYILKTGETLPTGVTPHTGEEKKPSPAAVQEEPVQSGSAAHATPVAERILKENKIDASLITGSGPVGTITQKDVETFLKQSATEVGKINATPSARRTAREMEVDLTAVHGSGPQGRIQANDVMNANVQRPSHVEKEIEITAVEAGKVTVVPLVGMRRTIAQNMTRSAQTAPHIILQVDVDMTAAESLRQRVMKMPDANGIKVSLTVIIAKVTAWALSHNPFINSRLEGDNILLLPNVNLGIAVALQEGLIVPVIQDANKKSIIEIAREIIDLSGRARENHLRQQDLSDGTFTISNLGMYGIDRFSAIINQPETGILAVGRMQDRFVPNADRQPVLHPLMTLTLSADHRVVDGAVAAKFLSDVRDGLEHPEYLVI